MPTGAASIWHGEHVPHSPTFRNGWARGHREYKNSKQETDQTVLTTTKALSKTTNCTFRANKWRGTKKKFPPDVCPLNFKFVAAPLPGRVYSLAV